VDSIPSQNSASVDAPRPHPAEALDPHQDRRLAEDLELVRGALSRQGEAVQGLAGRLTCVPHILAALNRRRGGLLSAHDLEDLAQDSLVRIWQKLATYRGHVGLEFWAHRFCFLEFQNRLRGRGRFLPMAPGPIEPVQDPDESAANDDELQRLEQGLSALEPDLEVVVRAKAMERRSFEEIGASLGIPAGTAKSRYYRGLSELKRALQRGGGRP
jgi:RNA polymerase sigma-70 factor (ECF subfamily)